SFFVAAFGSDRIARLSATQPGQVLSRVELSSTGAGATADPRHKRGPRGLALKAASQRLYVLNRIANSISIIDTANDKLLKEIPVGSNDPTPDIIRQGRGFLYDAKLSGNGTVSCASCHIDGELDALAWDLGDPAGALVTNRTVLPIPIPPFSLTNNSVFHPMKGPMTTQTLRGLKGQDPLHWRGDRTNFTHFNGAFASLLGGSALSQTDMNAFRDFINTITFGPNPNQNLDRTYPTNFAGGNAEAGRVAYMFTNYAGGLTCNNCHTAPPGTGSNGGIIPANALQESQDFKVPHLRNIYQKLGFDNTPGANSRLGFGLTHDGIDSTLQGFLSRAVFTNIRNDTTIKNNLAAFVQCFDTGLAPAVGYGRTVSTNNVTAPAVTADWALLESQAAATNIDLVVRGTVDGLRRGLLYNPASGTYRPDTATLPTFTRAQLTAKIQGGDTLTLLGVPPGSGQRLGIDRNLDGVLDADTPAPALQIARTGTNVVVDWPLAAAGFDLEATPGLSPAAWQSAPEPWEILDGRNYMTNASGDAGRFFRLHWKNAP
ncbi:MAG TPA: hypothetical protein VJA21_25040, partial [Verrucomicrobiae bacterium]